MSYDLLFQQALCLHERGDFDSAEKIYRQILQTAPDQPDVINLLGLIAQAKGVHQEAAALFSQAIRLSSNHAPYYFNFGISLQEWGKPYEALEAFLKVIELDSSVNEARLLAGQIYIELGKEKSAQDLFEQALKHDSSCIEAKIRLALLKQKLDRSSTFKELTQIAKENPENALVAYYLAALHYEDDNFRDSLLWAETSRKLAPSSDEIHTLLGFLSLKEEDSSTALTHFEQAIDINPRNIVSLVQCGTLAAQNKDFSQAESYFKKALDLEPAHLGAHINYADALYRQGKLPQALEEYRAAVVINPQAPEISYNLAVILKELGEYEEALGLFFNTARLQPEKQDTIFLNIAETLTLFSVSSPESAIKISENWLNSYPQNAIAKHTLAALKGENGEDNQIYTQKLFDHFSDDYELVLKRIGYQLPISLRNFVGHVEGTVVDLGCGSGLVGESLKTAGSRLIGIDISSKMLEKAAAKGIYQKLICSDINKYLQNRLSEDLPIALIVAADVFCYLGDISKTIALCAPHPLCFSIENLENSEKDFQIMASGRYRHQSQYIEKQLRQAGYQKIRSQNLDLRLENNRPVPGILYFAS